MRSRRTPRMRGRSFSVLSPTSRNTGSSAFADDDDRECGAFARRALSQIQFSNSKLVSRHGFTISPRVHASFCRKRPALSSQRAQGMPGARCARRSRAWCVENTRVSHHGHTGNTRHSPRNGFNGFLRALPGDRAFLPPSPLRSLLLKSLTPASGRQDHTTSPSASGALVFGAIHVHRIPPRVRDDREPPLRLGRDSGEGFKVIWVIRKPKDFCERGWMGQSP